tara:strand:- start:2691 stop:3011 length:321 start_codon:yes stop_codon:yes gene_type:complete
MPLVYQQLYDDILHTLVQLSKKKFKTPLDSQKYMAAGIAKAIEVYIRAADVQTITDTPNIKTMVGTAVASTGVVVHPNVVTTTGNTTTQGILVKGTGIGSGKGKVV